MSSLKICSVVIAICLIFTACPYANATSDFDMLFVHEQYIEGQQRISWIKESILNLFGYKFYIMHSLPASGEISLRVNGEELDEIRSQAIISPESALLIEYTIQNQTSELYHNMRIDFKDAENSIVSYDANIKLLESDNSIVILRHFKNDIAVPIFIEIYIDDVSIEKRELNTITRAYNYDG